MKFTDLFVRRPVLAAVVSLLILLIGLRAAFELPVRQYPELKNTVITVTTSYPGAAAELMQGFITTPIAQAVATAEGIDYMTASSAQGQSTVTAYVRLNYDPNVAMTDVMAKVQQVKYQIPDEANDPVILKSTGDTTAVMYMGFSSPELTGPAITDYLTRVVQPLLATVPGVAQAEILGGQPFAMRVWLDPDRLAARGISAADVQRGDPRQQLPVGAGPGQGLLHRRRHRRRHRPDQSRGLPRDGGQGRGRRPGPPARRRHDRAGRPEQQLVGDHERRVGRVHRRQRHADRQPAQHRGRRARDPADDPARPAADRAGAGGLRFDPVHPVLDRRGAATR